MFSHMTAGANDLVKSAAFYDKVMPLLGNKKLYDLPDQGMGYGTSEQAPMFWVGKPFNKEQATFGNGVTIGFLAPKRTVVDEFYAAALANGGTDEGAPGLRPHYHPNCYAAYVRDPDGNKLCCICHMPE